MSSDTSTTTSTFNPDDKELLLDYLKRKIDNEELPRDEIKEVELYKSGPKELIAKFGEGNKYKNYFFTSTDRVRRNSTDPKRSTKGGGSWQSRGIEEITDETNGLIGTKRNLVFKKGRNKEGKSTNWIMDEYKLDKSQSVNCENAPTDPMKLDQWVLCSVYNKGFSERWNQQRKDQESKEKEIDSQDNKVLDESQYEKREPTVPQGAITSSKGRQIDSQGPIIGNQDNKESVTPPFDNLPTEPIPKASDVGAKGDHTSVPHSVNSEESGTRSKEREIVLQGGPRNGNHDNKQSVLPPFDNLPAEPTPKASDVGAKGDHTSVPHNVLSEESGTSSKEREIVLQQGPRNGNQDNKQSVAPTFDNPPAEPTPKATDVGAKGDRTSVPHNVLSEESGTSSKEREIVLQQGPRNGNQDDKQSVLPPFDNLPAEPTTPKAADVGAKGDHRSVPHHGFSEESGTRSKEREIVLQQGLRNGNQDNKQYVLPPFDNLPAEPTPKASDVGAKGDHRSVPLHGFSEDLDTVLQQGPFNRSQANEVCAIDPVVYGPCAEPIPKDLNVGTKGDLMSADEAADLVTRDDEEQNAK